jgi:hypothetical protein
MKICTKCNVEQPLDNFSKDSKGKFGVKSRCKACIKEYDIKYNKVNIDKAQQYYIDNKARINEQSKQYYTLNRKELLEKQTQYGKDNPKVRRKSTAKYLKSNPEYYNNYRKQRYYNDPQFKLRIILGNRLNDVLKKNKTYKTSNIITLLGCSLDEVKEYLEKQFTTDMSWENHGIYWEVDHILPCGYFNLSDVEQQKQCFHYTNLQPLIKTDNRVKSNKVM